MLERVKFTNMNRSQSQTGDDYMSQFKHTALVTKKVTNFVCIHNMVSPGLLKQSNNSII